MRMPEELRRELAASPPEALMELICVASGLLLAKFDARMLKVQAGDAPVTCWLAGTPETRDMLGLAYRAAKEHLAPGPSIRVTKDDDGQLHIETTEEGPPPG